MAAAINAALAAAIALIADGMTAAGATGMAVAITSYRDGVRNDCRDDGRDGYRPR